MNLTEDELAFMRSRKKSFPMMALGSLDSAAVDAFATTTEASPSATEDLPLNVSLGNVTDIGMEEDPGESARYKVVVPVLMVCCLVTFLMNAVIVVAFPLIRSMSQVIRSLIWSFILN